VGKLFEASGFVNSGNNGIFGVTAVSPTSISTGVALTAESNTTTGNLIEAVNVKTPIMDPNNSANGYGLSSVFALDVTLDVPPTSTSALTSDLSSGSYPLLLWEFTDPRLGFTTVDPVVVRIKDPGDTSSSGGPRLNGKWYVVFASGPTGPIEGGMFKGYSDKPLTIFVLDLATGALLRTFNNLQAADSYNSVNAGIHTYVPSMPSYAFAGSLAGASSDVDRYNSNLAGAYSDDVVYIGYSKGNPNPGPTSWNRGGILRLLTYNSSDPSTWSVSTFVDNIGPVTSSVAKLQDTGAHQFWVYFGAGRYYVKGDDPTDQQALFGVKDPCYTASDTFSGSASSPCTTQVNLSYNSTSNLTSGTKMVDQTSSINAVPTSMDGWLINLGTAPTGAYPLRVITAPTAGTSGVVTFTTFAPSTNVCSYGGNTRYGRCNTTPAASVREGSWGRCWCSSPPERFSKCSSPRPLLIPETVPVDR
jgi:type IV pilus assembly protein PilY1